MHKCKLSDCVKEINNRTTENDQYEVLTSSKNGIFSQEEYFDKQVASKDNTGYKIIKKGQFTYRSMSDSGTFTINRLEDKDIGIVSPAYPVFEATNIDAEFLKYYFKSELFNKAIINLSQGSTRTALKFKDLIDIGIYLPEIEEQKKIVKILKNNDQVIEKYDKLIKEKEQFIKSQFVEMFIKTDYQRITLNEISSIKGEYGLSVSSKSYDESLGRYIRITDINDDGTLDTDWTSPMTDKNIENYILKEGDILFARTGGTVGKTYKYRLSDGKCSYAGYCIRFRIASEKTNVDYIYAYTKTNEYKNWIKDRQRVGAQPNINSNEYGNELEIPLPPQEKQKEFIELNKLIDKQKFNYINKIELLNIIINIFLGGKKI